MRHYVRVQDKSTATRSHKIGKLGEKLAEDVLARNGFTNIKNINDEQPNHGYADIYAERGGERYVISVKSRNKNQASGVLNGHYNLSSSRNHYELAKVAENARQAKAAWVTVTFEEITFNAYFGLLSALDGKNEIPMTPNAVKKHECLAENEPHNLDYSTIKNDYKDVDGARVEPTVIAADRKKLKMELDHVAVPSANIAASVEWYVGTLGASVLYQDGTWAFLKLGQGKLALVTPSQHPPHTAVRVDEAALEVAAAEAGKPVDTHRDGTRGIYVSDPDGNQVELICYPANATIYDGK